MGSIVAFNLDREISASVTVCDKATETQGDRRAKDSEDEDEDEDEKVEQTSCGCDAASTIELRGRVAKA